MGLYDQNSWRNDVSKLACLEPFLQRPRSALIHMWCVAIGVATGRTDSMSTGILFNPNTVKTSEPTATIIKKTRPIPLPPTPQRVYDRHPSVIMARHLCSQWRLTGIPVIYILKQWEGNSYNS